MELGWLQRTAEKAPLPHCHPRCEAYKTLINLQCLQVDSYSFKNFTVYIFRNVHSKGGDNDTNNPHNNIAFKLLTHYVLKKSCSDSDVKENLIFLPLCMCCGQSEGMSCGSAGL